MEKKAKTGKIIFYVYLFLLHIVAGYLLYEKFGKTTAVEDASKKEQPVIEIPTTIILPEEREAANSIAQKTNPTSENTQINANIANANAANFSVSNTATTENQGKLLIPVIGIKKSELSDTFNDARSEGRVHNAIDIMAKGGTPVVAAADGEIAKFFDSKLGGITIYQYSVDKKTVYYYAHLQKRADNLSEHDFVKQGTVIGYVGDTGNAGAGNYHLHFGISILSDPKRYWDGTEINPFPILKDGIEAK